jgi:hypothetical protein
MAQHPKYLRHAINCPENDNKAVLLSEWRIENGQETLNGIRCDNLHLKDLSGTDCQWSCWEKISGTKP